MKKNNVLYSAMYLATTFSVSSFAETVTYKIEGQLIDDNQFLQQFEYATAYITFENPGLLDVSAYWATSVAGPPGIFGAETDKSELDSIYMERGSGSMNYEITATTGSLTYSNTSTAGVSITDALVECDNTIPLDCSDRLSISSTNMDFSRFFGSGVNDALDSLYFFDSNLSDFISEADSATLSIFDGDLSYDIASISQVPIPATAWLFGSSLLGFLLARRKLS